jgi:hypothetical protein
MSNKDPRLGRLIEFDPRSKEHRITAILPGRAVRPRSYRWACGITLDQKDQGSCVGFGWSHELAARPSVIPNINYDSAFAVYKKAQTLDQWPGQDYSGTSVIAGIKAVQAMYPDAIHSYKWAFSIEEIVATLGYQGPVVLGIAWYDKMYEPDKEGFIHVSGSLAGGHCILARGVNVVGKFIILRNSWGPAWGVNGDCKISYNDLEYLMKQEGEACVPIGRQVLST